MAKLALWGGEPVKKTPFPAWPSFDDHERAALLEVLVQLHKSYWVFIEPCVLTLRQRAEGGARGAKEKTLNALRSPPSGREAIQRLFPRMSCEAALGRCFCGGIC